MGVLIVTCYIFEFSELLRKNATNTQVRTLVLCIYAWMKIPHLLSKLLPFIALFANLLCFWSLKQSHQLLVARGSGRSMLQILKPFLGSTLLLSVWSMGILNPVSTWCLRWLDEQTQQRSSWIIQPTEHGLWVLQEQSGDATRMMRIGRFDGLSLKSEDVSVFEWSFGPQEIGSRRIEAASGVVKGDVWALSNAYDVQDFQEARSHDVLLIDQSVDGVSLMKWAQEAHSLPLWQWPQTLKKFQKIGLDTHRFWVHLHMLLSKTALMFCFVFLSALCVMRAPLRTQGSFVFATAILVAFMTYLLSDVMYSMTLARRVGVWGLWIPSQLCALAIVWGMAYERKSR